MKLPPEIVSKLRPAYEGKVVGVTGGAGFIGGHLIDALHALGCVVTALDDLSNSTLDHLGSLIDLDPEHVRFVRGSVLDDDALADAIDESSLVFHLAAIGSVPLSIAEPQRSWSVNSTGTVRVLEHARRAKAMRVVYSASSSAYGDGPELPKVESMTPDPRSPYAASKLAGEHAAAAWSAAYGLSTVSLRFFNVFGPRQPTDSAYAAVVPAFARRMIAGEPPNVFGDGTQSRDFTPVSCAVLALLLAGAAERRLAGEVINVGMGQRTSLLELATMMATMIETAPVDDAGRPVVAHSPERPGDVRHSLADLSRARELLGYRPVITLEAELEGAIAWYRASMASARG